jgi:CO/xanthine dehydrogenase Mo-binding subunit
MTQNEVLRASGPTPGAFMRVKIGAKKDGKMTAASAEIYFEAGAFPGSATGAAAEQMFTAYDIPNGEIDAYEVLVNKPHVNDYRAPGDTQVTFAMEQVVDELAERLAIDPLDLRILNVAREGSTSISGVVHNQIDALQVLEAAKKHPHYQNQPCKQNYGTGVAFAWWPNWGAQSSCAINVNYDGTLAMTTGSVDLSGTRLTIAMQAAEVLGVDVEDIKSSVVDTDSTGYNDPTGGSRVTYATGIAAVEAAKSVIRQLKERAAILWDVSAEKVEFEAGVFYAGTERMALRQLAQRQSETGGQVTGVANIDARGWGSGFGVHIADVSVDPETGKVQVVRYTAVQGVGKAIHPTLVEGQIQGGVAQGIGWALWEGYWYDAQGRMMNPNRLDYKQPTSLDLPHIEPVLVEVPGPNHPFGVRGVGEVPIVPPPATIANALRRATGKRLHKLPMTPDQILRVTGVIE